VLDAAPVFKAATCFLSPASDTIFLLKPDDEPLPMPGVCINSKYYLDEPSAAHLSFGLCGACAASESLIRM
jgi:hypothetical protein